MGPPSERWGGCSTGKWGSYPGREGILPHGKMGVSSHGKMGNLVLPMGKWGCCPGRDGVLPPGVMGVYAMRNGCPAPREMGVLPQVSWSNTGDGGYSPQLPALCPDSSPLQMNLGLIAVVLVAFVSPVVVAHECKRRAKELGTAGSPLAAPPGAEIHAETPH